MARTQREKLSKLAKQQLFLLCQLFICIAAGGITLFFYVEKQNELTELRLAIPLLSKEVKSIQEENIRLTYEIESFESPINLMELVQKPEFSHLKYPYLKDQIVLDKPPRLK